MFQFTGFPSLTLFYSCKDDRSLSCRVSPFRYPWIITYLQLPKAFRSLSRLSSALSAKASTLRSSLYDLWSLTIALVILFLCVHKVFLGFLGCLESFFSKLLISRDNSLSIAVLIFEIKIFFFSQKNFTVCDFQGTFGLLNSHLKTNLFVLKSLLTQCLYYNPFGILFNNLATSYFPVPSPAKYHRPIRS